MGKRRRMEERKRMDESKEGRGGKGGKEQSKRDKQWGKMKIMHKKIKREEEKMYVVI